MVLKQILFSLLVASLFSAAGAFSLFISKNNLERVTPYLVSLSAGTIFGGVFIHLVYRLSNSFGYSRATGFLIIVGMGGSFVLERIVHWHCHHRGAHEEPLPYVLAVGDSIHNILDGVLVATGFLASTSSGMAVTAAVIAHKIPKELGDFGVMVESGFSRLKALSINLGISMFMFVGAGAVLALSSFSSLAVPLLLPLVIGNFVYIAGSDLLPEFKESDVWLKHLTVFSAGVALIYVIPYFRALF